MRILLINSNLRDDLLAAPPIGLCYVASAVEMAGHDVEVLDLCFRRNALKELERAIGACSPEVVGISIRNIDNTNMLHPISYLPDAASIVRCIRRLTNVPLVVGGSGASLDPEGVLKLLDADFIVVSDGESAFAELLACIEKGESPERIPGVGMMRNGVFHLNSPTLTDFRSGNPEVGKWIDMMPYQKMGSSYNIQTRRGCRQRCTYCTYNQVLEGSRLRMRSPVDVVDELEEVLFKFRPEGFEFVDSVFNDPVDHCVEILEEIVRRPWKARFTAMGMSPRGLDRQFLDLMWRAGFTSFWISPESASPAMIRNYRKGFSVDDVVRAAEAINRTPFTVLWNFLIGGPGETNDTLQETLDFTWNYLKREDHPPYHMAIYFVGVRIYPGTELWEISRKEGFVNETSDPLQQIWYLSEELDLDRATRQMLGLGVVCPEFFYGVSEKYLALSKFIAFFGGLFRKPKPYWSLIYRANRAFVKARLNFILRPPNMATIVRNRLIEQGYQGPLLHKTS